MAALRKPRDRPDPVGRIPQPVRHVAPQVIGHVSPGASQVEGTRLGGQVREDSTIKSIPVLISRAGLATKTSRMLLPKPGSPRLASH